jgi:exopolysaccharide biosynthesis polyprenyl glycosylphosphotransferase
VARTALRESELGALLFIGDAIVAGIAAMAAPSLYALLDPEFAPRTDLRVFGVAFTLAWVVLLRLLGGGDLASPRFGRRTLAAVGRSLLASAAVVLVMFFFAPFVAPRGSTLVTLPLVGAATLVWRYGYLRTLRARILERRVAIVGTDDAARRTATAIAHWDGAMRYEIVAFLTAADPEGASVLDAPVVHIGDDPWKTIADVGVDLLVVGHTQSVPPTLLAELTRCFEHGVEAVPATILYEQLTGRVLAAALEADWYAALPTHTRGVYMFAKRAFDVVVALVAGAVVLLLSPFVALAIVIDSGSPILLRQVRVGLRGEPFVVHKFRTMRPDAESDGRPRWSSPRDERVTRVGRFLRRSRLDEVPQFWDVLRGKMSLIGPRPERPEFVEQLARELPLYRARSLVRPGITGWAQIQYPYAGSLEGNLAKLEYDLYYIRHLGSLLDIAIALRTLPVMLVPRRHSEQE